METAAHIAEDSWLRLSRAFTRLGEQNKLISVTASKKKHEKPFHELFNVFLGKQQKMPRTNVTLKAFVPKKKKMRKRNA